MPTTGLRVCLGMHIHEPMHIHGTLFQFPQEPKAAGQLEDALFTWVFGEMAELISASELFAICSQFLRVESYYTAFNCYPAPKLLFNISGIKSFWPLGR